MARSVLLLALLLASCTPAARDDLAEIAWDRAMNRAVFCATILALGGDDCLRQPL
jgi:hypothetical protein